MKTPSSLSKAFAVFAMAFVILRCEALEIQIPAKPDMTTVRRMYSHRDISDSEQHGKHIGDITMNFIAYKKQVPHYPKKYNCAKNGLQRPRDTTKTKNEQQSVRQYPPTE